MNSIQPVMMGGKTEDVSVYRSYEMHPKPALKTKARGKATDLIGAIYPGTPMSAFIFDDQKVSVMENSHTEGELHEFSLAIMSLRVRSADQCAKGYGITIKQIRSIPSLKPTTYGLYNFFYKYTDKESVYEQTNKLMSLSHVTGTGKSDIDFVQQSVRKGGTSDVNEKPLIIVDLKDDCNAHYQHSLSIHKDNVLLLEMQAGDSLYAGKKFAVHLHSGVFTPATSVAWIRDYYQWCLQARVARIVILHDEYWMKKGGEKFGCAHGECVIVVDEQAMFKAQQDKSTFNMPGAVNAFFTTASEQLPKPLDLKETKQTDGGPISMRYSGWAVSPNIAETGTGQFCILDTRKAMDPLQGSAEHEEHASLMCQVYPGMSKHRRVWLMYLCSMQDNVVLSIMPVGVQAVVAQDAAGLLEVPSNVNTYADPFMLLE